MPFRVFPWACFHHSARANPLPAFHRHNEVELTFLREGRMSYEFNASRFELPLRRLCLFWGGIPHRCIHWSGKVDLRVICIPIPSFMQWRLPRSFLKAVLSGQLQSETDSRCTRWDEHLMQVWERDILSRQQTLASIVTSEIEARLQRLAFTVSEFTTKQTGTGGNALSRFLGVMCVQASDSLTLTEMAKMAGLHPKYALRLFKKSFGITALEYLHRLRISHAQRLLATTRNRVADIALACGFNSASQFYAVFHKVCAASPGDFRRGIVADKGQGGLFSSGYFMPDV
jgi:AraC family transcriptional regulator, melibiose operon regulatory protein